MNDKLNKSNVGESNVGESKVRKSNVGESKVRKSAGEMSESERPLPQIHETRLRDPSNLFQVEQIDLEFSNGARRTYERMRSSGLGAVIIVPMLDDDTVLLVREYAVGLNHYEIGLPKGRLEAGESILEGAQRELKEEIGYGARDLRILTRLSLAPGYMTHITCVVLARDLYPEKLQGDEPEELEVVPWSIHDLLPITARDDCTEGRSIAAMYIARDYLAAEKSNKSKESS